MTNEEWWAKIEKTYTHENAKWILGDALRAVVELHRESVEHKDIPAGICIEDGEHYPCPTIQKIMDELK